MVVNILIIYLNIIICYELLHTYYFNPCNWSRLIFMNSELRILRLLSYWIFTWYFNEKMRMMRKILVFTTTNLHRHAQNNSRHFSGFWSLQIEIIRHSITCYIEIQQEIQRGAKMNKFAKCVACMFCSCTFRAFSSC